MVIVGLIAVAVTAIVVMRPANFVAVIENRPVWQWDGDAWRVAGNAPACEDPLAIGAPIDMTRVSSRLYPGQVRGTDFKPHGGLAIDDATDTAATIYAIRDARLVRVAHYLQDGTEQYLLDFVDDCGVMFRYDHLARVTPDISKYTDRLEAKEGDSRTTEVDGLTVQKGAAIATAIGLPGNVFFDLGVYDLRRQNEASKTELYKTDPLRIDDKEQSFYAVCWFDLLPPVDRAIANALPTRANDKEGAVSDYCQIR